MKTREQIKKEERIKNDEAMLKARLYLLERAKNCKTKHDFTFVANAISQLVDNSYKKFGRHSDMEQIIIDIASTRGKDMEGSIIKK